MRGNTMNIEHSVRYSMINFIGKPTYIGEIEYLF